MGKGKRRESDRTARDTSIQITALTGTKWHQGDPTVYLAGMIARHPVTEGDTTPWLATWKLRPSVTGQRWQLQPHDTIAAAAISPGTGKISVGRRGGCPTVVPFATRCSHTSHNTTQSSRFPEWAVHATCSKQDVEVDHRGLPVRPCAWRLLDGFAIQMGQLPIHHRRWWQDTDVSEVPCHELGRSHVSRRPHLHRCAGRLCTAGPPDGLAGHREWRRQSLVGWYAALLEGVVRRRNAEGSVMGRGRHRVSKGANVANGAPGVRNRLRAEERGAGRRSVSGKVGDCKLRSRHPSTQRP
eukprot:scaffold3096_cov115-Isochrysis_galbana.AAC.4